ncbi:transcription factor grauzone-like [Rhagoletis pomonella]|uniref:transcription factor grauzone-like n=1 Tax=Rhagoletis pomonella TaxID=28610 RepID=UPI001782AD28|nr:transcription factor grauzone-like [Rhagoletis pomonella]
MICRLCLEESYNTFEIFSENGGTETAKTIAKYFHIEVQRNDIISKKICEICWQRIFDFHSFWLTIDGKQKTLQTHLAGTEIKPDFDAFETEEFPGTNLSSHIHYKSSELREPEIDIIGVKTNVFVDELEIEVNQIKDVDIKEDHVSIPTLSLTSDKETKQAVGVKNSKKRNPNKKNSSKATGRHAKNLKKSKVSIGPKHDSKDIEDLGSKAKANASQDSQLSMREVDEFIAANTQLTCCLCSAPLKNFTELKKHFRVDHHCNGYVTCCNNRYLRRTLYVDHLKLHMDPDFFKCAICNKQLKSRNNYKNHMNTRHPDEEKLLYQCKSCPRKFAKRYILDYHLKYNHQPERNHICKTCNKGFINSSVLKQHERTVHLNASNSVCEVCGKCLKTQQNLLTHMEDMHSREPRPEVQCKICQKWLKNIRCLNKHMIGHRDQTSGQPFKCTHCGAEKSTRHALTSHIRYHHSGRTFTCTMCSKEFKSPRALKEHESTHTGTYLYTCPFCPKTFRSHGNMHNHRVSHSDKYVPSHSQPNEATKRFLNTLPENGKHI